LGKLSETEVNSRSSLFIHRPAVAIPAAQNIHILYAQANKPALLLEVSFAK
jgi:hypothetical protein